MVFIPFRYLLSIGNVAVSLVLGVIALVLTFAFFPTFMNTLMRNTGGLKEQLVSLISNPQYQFIARTVLHESSILLMGFTLTARIVLGMLQALGHRLVSGGPNT